MTISSCAKAGPFALFTLFMFLSACTTTSSTVHVDANTQDVTLPSALWLQADIAGRPLSNVYLKDPNNTNGDISMEVSANTVVRLTAVGTDNDSGVRRLELAGLVTAYRLSPPNRWVRMKDHVSDNFGGVTQIPLTMPRDVPKTAHMQTTIDFATLTQQYDWVIINLQAVAESGATPSSNQAATTHVMTLFFKRPGTPPL